MVGEREVADWLTRRAQELVQVLLWPTAGACWGPGHAPVALEDCEYVDFSPTEAFNHVLDHVRNGAG